MTQSQNPGVGGRGKIAPYNTTHVRIPEALKPTVELMANSYKEFVLRYEDAFDPELITRASAVLVEQTLEQPPILNDEYKELVSRILKQSLKLKANSDQLTKDKIRFAIALISA